MNIRKIIGEIYDIEVIAKGSSVKIRKRLEKLHGKGNWRKLKGQARVLLSDGTVKFCEIHWFEAHGIGKRDLKVKFYIG
jgi:hypothetical protein